MKPKNARNMAFTYGLGQLTSARAATAPGAQHTGSVPPEADFYVTAYVDNANKGDEVELILPEGSDPGGGRDAKKTVEEGGKRVSVFWKVDAGKAGVYMIEATSGGAKTKPTMWRSRYEYLRLNSEPGARGDG